MKKSTTIWGIISLGLLVLAFTGCLQGTTPDSDTGTTPDSDTGPYAVGKTGPTGGIVFYDKGMYTNGWRYLEAAPPELEFQAAWGAYQKDVNSTGLAVGSGKRNTELIVTYLKSIGETDKAAQLAVAISFDGYKDWFLPSRDELDLMYKNLKAKELGGFGDDDYWSSSQGNTDYAWNQKFIDGYQRRNYYDTKNYTYSVRVVRAF